jgi:hypothetical protein
LDGARKKVGSKVHAMMVAFIGRVEFARITEAREHDQQFLYHLKLVAYSRVLFEKGYTTYCQYSKWTREKTWVITRDVRMQIII